MKLLSAVLTLSLLTMAHGQGGYYNNPAPANAPAPKTYPNPVDSGANANYNPPNNAGATQDNPGDLAAAQGMPI